MSSEHEQEKNYSIQDFSLIKSTVDKFKEEYELDNSSFAFYFFTLNTILSLQEDEIKDSITDTNYLKKYTELSGHDRGIDSIYIDEENNTIHLFNCKYTEIFEKTKNNFPSSEIDKIVSFLNSLMQKDENLKTDINAVLYGKVVEIWKIFDVQNPKFVIHICANFYKSFEQNEKLRFEREIQRHSNFSIEYNLMTDFILLLTRKGKQIVNAKVRAIDKNFFEKSDGEIRALVVDIDAKDIIRIVLDDEEIRNAAVLENYNKLKNFKILEDAFEDNV